MPDMPDYALEGTSEDPRLGLKVFGPIPLRRQLEQENKNLTAQIAVNNELIQLLNDNPAIEKFMDLAGLRRLR